MELRRKRDENLDKTLVLLSLLVWLGVGGIPRKHATGSMMWGLGESCKGRGLLSLSFCPKEVPGSPTSGKVSSESLSC